MSNSHVPVRTRELNMPEGRARYGALGQIGTDEERAFKINMEAQVWYPLSEEKPLTQGFAQTSDFCLMVPKREPWDKELEQDLPWFLNSFVPHRAVFPEAAMRLAEICHATPKLELREKAFGNEPTFGALPGFYYEAEKSMGFRVNPQSMYSSHVLFFSTGCRYDGKLVGLAKLATESSVWMQVKSETAGWRINLVIVHTHLLAKALNFKTPVDMLRELFIEPFNERYENAEKLATARTESWLRDKKASLSGLKLEELSELVEEYNTKVMTFWTCFVKPSPNSWLKGWVDRPPTVQLLDSGRAMIYHGAQRDMMLACSVYNMDVLRRMMSRASGAMEPDKTPFEREHEFAQIFSIDDRLDEYSASRSKANNCAPSTAG